VDTLPDSGAFYYWIRVDSHDGKPTNIGPLRVGPDKENAGTYINVADNHLWLVIRTHASATISWEYPEAKYRRIIIKRNTSKKITKRKSIHATLERTGDIIDIFPDAEVEGSKRGQSEIC
jgi:hypothetical protein